ncbi:MAG: Flp family type IVb pilin [Deltaproteobacteria bacterium]|nr:MAG: Flp family type IVb pilin [Deltaproteobacteria bacterium]
MSQLTMKLRLFHAVLYALGNNKGAAMVEYALLCALVAIVAAGSLTRLGQTLSQGALYLASILNAAGR